LPEFYFYDIIRKFIKIYSGEEMEDQMHFVDFVTLCRGKEKIYLSQKEKKIVEESRGALKSLIKSNPDQVYYGINTGVGALLKKRIPRRKLREFQENLIMSHACGVGLSLEKETVKGMMLHMILNLKRGYSGIRLETLELLIEMFNKDIIPVVPEKGSLGASGDLVPQAYISLALIGKGEVWHQGERLSTISVFEKYKIQPVKLQIGEAIALLNGTALMSSLLAFTAHHADNLIKAAHIAAAMSIAALKGNIQPFIKESQKLSYHRGREVSAAYLAELLSSKKTTAFQPNEDKSLQDAYSLRCASRVFGNFLETLYYHVWKVALEEINNFSGNPEIFSKEKKIEQGGNNFHGQSLAQAADNLSIALTSLAGISERRIERLLNPSLSGLPPFLTKNSGLNTGLMIAHYTAAALVAENRVLANPASIHSIPVAAGQEDFVSMGALAARKAWEICKNTEYAIAIEILCATQALDFRKPLPESNIKKIHKIVRSYVPHLGRDRKLDRDIEKIFSLIHNCGNEYQNENEFLNEVKKTTGIVFFFETDMLDGN